MGTSRGRKKKGKKPMTRRTNKPMPSMDDIDIEDELALTRQSLLLLWAQAQLAAPNESQELAKLMELIVRKEIANRFVAGWENTIRGNPQMPSTNQMTRRGVELIPLVRVPPDPKYIEEFIQLSHDGIFEIVSSIAEGLVLRRRTLRAAQKSGVDIKSAGGPRDISGN